MADDGAPARPDKKRVEPRPFPYKYGSDLHWLWGWGERIRCRIDDELPVGELERWNFMPDSQARDAMMRFSVRYPLVIKQVDEYLDFAEERFKNYLEDKCEENSIAFLEAIERLQQRIETGSETISNAESTTTMPDEPPPKLTEKIIAQETLHDAVRLSLSVIHEMRSFMKGTGIPLLGKCHSLVCDRAVIDRFLDDEDLVRRLGEANGNRVVEFHGYSANSWAEIVRKIVEDWSRTILEETFEIVDHQIIPFHQMDPASFKRKWPTLSSSLKKKREFSIQKLEAELNAEERRLESIAPMKGTTDEKLLEIANTIPQYWSSSSEDSLERAFQIAAEIVREGDKHPKFSQDTAVAAEDVIKAVGDYRAERASILEPLRSEGIGDLMIVPRHSLGPNVGVGDQFVNGILTRTFPDDAPAVKELGHIEQTLTSALRQLSSLLRPKLPYGWRGDYDSNVTTPAELLAYVTYRTNSAVGLLESKAKEIAAEVTHNVERALLEWKHQKRPPIPDIPTSNDEARRQLHRMLQWIDANLITIPSRPTFPQTSEAQPNDYLFGWPAILGALKRNNNDEEKSRIRRLNDSPLHPGPIVIPGQGSQPKVEKSKLIKWWNDLGNRFDEIDGREQSIAASVSDQYKHGRDGIVAPIIGGSVKKRRKREG